MVLVKQRQQRPDVARWEGLTDVPARFARMFDEMFTPSRTVPMLGWLPPVDIVESDSEITMTAELPGMAGEDVQIEVDNNILTVKGEKKEEREEKEARYHCYERSYGMFERSFAVPSSVDLSKIEADFENGVLEVHMPKTAQAKARRIEISK